VGESHPLKKTAEAEGRPCRGDSEKAEIICSIKTLFWREVLGQHCANGGGKKSRTEQGGSGSCLGAGRKKKQKNVEKLKRKRGKGKQEPYQISLPKMKDNATRKEHKNFERAIISTKGYTEREKAGGR